MNEYLEKIVDVKIDRPLGTHNTEHNFIYTVNYGYIQNSKEKIHAYVLGEYKPIEKFRGKVIGIIERKNDNKDILVVAKTINSHNTSDIETLTNFQERFYDTEITCCGRNETKPYIRVAARGLARRQNQILVTEGYDSITDTYFWGLPGGGVEFWETSEEALNREFKEELNAKITSKKYIGKIENIFKFEGIKQHQIIFLYEIQLPEEYYNREEIELNENGAICKALWVDKDEFIKGSRILYPSEIKKWL